MDWHELSFFFYLLISYSEIVRMVAYIMFDSVNVIMLCKMEQDTECSNEAAQF